jgi:dipeptide/tripeptide permease
MLLGVVTFWRGFSKLGDKGLPPPGREGFGSVLVVAIGGLFVAPLVFLLLSKVELAGYVCLALMIGIVAYLLWYGSQKDKVTFQRIIALVILLLGNIAFWASFEQAGNSLNFFARDNVKLQQEEHFPLGGTRGKVVEATAAQLVLDKGFQRDETVDITVTYPSKENPNVRVEAAAKVPPGSREARAPILIADLRATGSEGAPEPLGLLDNAKVDRTQDIVEAVAAADAARVVAAEAAAKAAVAEPQGTEAPPGPATEEAEAAKARADKLAVDFVVGPVREFEWFQSVNAIFIVMLGPVFSWLWVFLDRKGRNPSIPFKFGLGLVQVGLGFALIVWSFRGADQAGLVPWYMLTGLYLIHTTGELCISPVGLSMVTKLAPPTITGFVMGGWFLSIANANFAASLFSAVAGGGHGAEATQTGAEALAVYESAYVPIIWMSVGIGVLFLVLSKQINKLMHGVK